MITKLSSVIHTLNSWSPVIDLHERALDLCWWTHGNGWSQTLFSSGTQPPTHPVSLLCWVNRGHTLQDTAQPSSLPSILTLHGILTCNLLIVFDRKFRCCGCRYLFAEGTNMKTIFYYFKCMVSSNTWQTAAFSKYQQSRYISKEESVTSEGAWTNFLKTILVWRPGYGGFIVSANTWETAVNRKNQQRMSCLCMMEIIFLWMHI